LKRITDGTAKTFLYGEKHVPEYATGYLVNSPKVPAGHNIWTYDNCIYNGDEAVTVGRYAGGSATLAISPSEQMNNNFGGPHTGVCQFVFGDGSVRPISVEIDSVILGYLGARDDGQAIDENSIY
jgi:prepilin-type processing-associated H-X9-DG protein